MNRFLNYLTPVAYLELEFQVETRFMELALDDRQRKNLLAFLEPLRVKDRATYEHCLRVGSWRALSASSCISTPRRSSMPGCCMTSASSRPSFRPYRKTEGWLPADTEEIKNHVSMVTACSGIASTSRPRSSSGIIGSSRVGIRELAPAAPRLFGGYSSDDPAVRTPAVSGRRLRRFAPGQ